MKDFFVSYNSNDKAWAEWIAWTLEDAGYTVIIQAWDFRAGGNFVLDMQRAAQEAQRTIAVLSDHYLQAAYTQPEWAAAFAQDPQSLERKLIPIRIQDCQPSGMLSPIVYVDLVGKTEAEAQQAVLQMMADRLKPATKPTFPGASPAHTLEQPPTFPGDSALPEPEPVLSLWVQGWDRVSGAEPPTVELDWQAYCDRPSRKVPTPEQWDVELFPQLQAAKQTLDATGGDRTIELVGNRPLTMTLAIGFTFPAVGDYHFRMKQRTGSESVWWSSSTPASGAQFQVVQERGMEGDDLLLALVIGREDIWSDIDPFHRDHLDRFKSLVFAMPKDDLGQNISNADAIALAAHGKQMIRMYRSKYRASCTHLIVAGPGTFALFFGQQLNAVRDVLAYELAEDGGYEPSVRLRTG